MKAKKKVLCVYGTRPEIIKVAPVISRLRQDPDLDVVTVSSGQHGRAMLEPVERLFGVVPNYDLQAMAPGKSLDTLFSNVQLAMSEILSSAKPDLVLVHGDTTTASASAVAAFHQRVAIGHIEAGLRTGNIDQPFPEEFNRRLVDLVSARFYAPTELSARSLRQEGVPDDKILVTGNSVIDALLHVVRKIESSPHLALELAARHPYLGNGKRVVLVTAHRRENHGSGISSICDALARIARRDDVEIVLPVHPNPAVGAVVRERLARFTNIHLIAPAEYLDFVYLLSSACVILTDSGGIQEEAPSLGKPVFVMRDVTERPEAVEAGTVVLVGSSCDRIVASVESALDDPSVAIAARSAKNPYGDGSTSEAIHRDIVSFI